MKTQIVCLAILLLGTAGAARADDHGRGGTDHDNWFHGEAQSVRAPEIDPASMMSGLTLLAGALVVLRGRRATNPKG
ncbi:MAG TPA: hypothetical protein VKG63_13285 [Steroidobacteraceae bacterium]|nr:hypothetical protein [Steroidobacteraceae bacterium]